MVSSSAINTRFIFILSRSLSCCHFLSSSVIFLLSVKKFFCWTLLLYSRRFVQMIWSIWVIAFRAQFEFVFSFNKHSLRTFLLSSILFIYFYAFFIPSLLNVALNFFRHNSVYVLCDSSSDGLEFLVRYSLLPPLSVALANQIFLSPLKTKARNWNKGACRGISFCQSNRGKNFIVSDETFCQIIGICFVIFSVWRKKYFLT